MKTLFSIIFLSMLTSLTFAQILIKGKVTDVSGDPIPGVNIYIKGTTNGTISDINGKYQLNVNKNDVIVFKFIGYKTVEEVVGDKTTINVTLKEDTKQLAETVVVGYGTMRKSDITGSTVSVKVTDDVAQQYPTVDQLLQGRAPGVQVISNDGTPGSGISVRIRGTNSLRSNNEPLYVVDGIIITTAGEDASTTVDYNDYSENQNGLNGINPADIESIEVLKDASATAIYGSRGANGVVLITTKKGKKGRAKIDAYYNAAFTQIGKELDVLDGPGFAQYMNEAALLNHNSPRYYIDGDKVYGISNGEISSQPFKEVYWQDYAYRVGVSHTAGVSFSGGSDKGSYYISTRYNDAQGVADNSQMKNGDMRININRKLTDKLKLDGQISLFYSNGTFPQSGSKLGANGSFVKSTVTFNPLIGDDIVDYQNELQVSNPYSWINDYEEKSKEFKALASLTLTYELPVKGLKYQIKAAGNNRIKDRRKFYGLTTYVGSGANGKLSMANQEKWAWNINNLLMYYHAFKKVHKLNAMIGYVYDGNFMEDRYYTVENFSTTQFMTDGPEYGTVIKQPLITYPREQTMNSFLARANYSYKGKYIATATFRADGSSKFAEGQRYGYFPSFSLAWRVMEERFMDNLTSVSNLKLRAGWGQTGNQAITPYQTITTYAVALYANPDNSTSNVYVPSNIANPDLTWETTVQTNVGLDIGLFKNRLISTIDVYYKETNDLLQQVALPTSTGYSKMYINRGTISNKGIDFNINGVILQSKDLELSVGANISINRNEILELGIPDAPVYIDGAEEMRSYYLGDNVSTGNTFKCPANIFMAGESIGMFWGFKTDGIYQEDDPDLETYGAQPGDVKILDLNQDGIIDENDRTFIGDPNPDFLYGFNMSLRYKRFSFNMDWSGVYGNEIANGFGINYYTATGNSQNIHPAAYYNAWRPDRPSNTYPRIGYNEENAIAMTDRIIEDGSYLRLNNLTLSYNLPTENLFKQFRIYASGKNLLTFTKYSGYDPNVTSFMWNSNIQGVDWNPFPNARIYIVGINITF
ncbi:MAG: TonB-dependent receptor [Chlorobi bacterium]|nr:TonB-dependent receptor [Chlorobiota bacterium]